MEKDYNALKECCGGLASVMPGTRSVEADFSLIILDKGSIFKVINRLLLGIYFASQTIQELGEPVFLVTSPLIERK